MKESFKLYRPSCMLVLRYSKVRPLEIGLASQLRQPGVRDNNRMTAELLAAELRDTDSNLSSPPALAQPHSMDASSTINAGGQVYTKAAMENPDR
jgi:hypothetical protein